MADSPRIDELRRRVDNDPASILFAQLAEEYRRAGLLDDAVRVCRAGLLRYPTYLSARVTLARSLMDLGQHDAAQNELTDVIAAAPDNLAALRSLSDLHQRRTVLFENGGETPLVLNPVVPDQIVPDQIVRDQILPESIVAALEPTPVPKPAPEHQLEPLTELAFPLESPTVDESDRHVENSGPIASDRHHHHTEPADVPVEVVPPPALTDVSNGALPDWMNLEQLDLDRQEPSPADHLQPDFGALRQLERWLDAIALDRQARHDRAPRS